MDDIVDISEERLKHTPAGIAQENRLKHRLAVPPNNVGAAPDTMGDSECPDRGLANDAYERLRARAMTGAPREPVAAPLPHVHGDYCSHPTERPLAAFVRATADWWRALARLWPGVFK